MVARFRMLNRSGRMSAWLRRPHWRVEGEGTATSLPPAAQAAAVSWSICCRANSGRIRSRVSSVSAARTISAVGPGGVRGPGHRHPYPATSEFHLFAKLLHQSVGHLWSGKQGLANKGSIYPSDQHCVAPGLQLPSWFHLPPRLVPPLSKSTQ